MSKVMIGTGVQAEVKGDTIVLTIDAGAKPRPSASGKTLVVATTSGFRTLENGQAISLNLTAPVPAE